MRIDLDLQLAVSEAAERLRLLMTPGFGLSIPAVAPEKRPLVGNVDGTAFSCRLNTRYGHGLAAHCEGFVVPTPSGCRLHASIYPSIFGLVFVGVWLVLVLWTGFGRISDAYSANPNDLWAILQPLLLPVVIAICVFGSSFLLARGEARRIVRILRASFTDAIPTA